MFGGLNVCHGAPATTAMNRVNGRSFNGSTEVARRSENQQQRIANGMKAGQLNPGQVARQENRQQKNNQNIHANRQVNGGHLKKQQHRQINREQDRASKKIEEKRRE